MMELNNQEYGPAESTTQQERAERFETDTECLLLADRWRMPAEARIANLSKSGALIAVPEDAVLEIGQRLLIIPLDAGAVNVELIEHKREIMTGTVVREYRSDGPKRLGIHLSPYPMSLFRRIVGWVKDHG